ncbi:hypothetical protein BC835DRAFT_1419673 [Cytidiella melzeri]|nr:hypothetical protein BC835DRAFT_1419673 [Cytidiella melzeri]
MSNIQRSKSTPHVAPLQPFLVPSGSKTHLAAAKPRIRRHQTSLALTDLVPGHRTPRTEDDPFSLGGFFPSPAERPDAVWNWLHVQEDSVADVTTEETEDEDGVGGDGTRRAHVMFDHAEDQRTAEMILREDKLGVLSLRSDMFSSGHAVQSQKTTGVYRDDSDRLLSPYCEDNPLDDDAVYLSLAALRNAHSAVLVPARAVAECDGSGPLFCPVEDASAGKYEEDGSWQAVMSQGVGLVLDYFAM